MNKNILICIFSLIILGSCKPKKRELLFDTSMDSIENNVNSYSIKKEDFFIDSTLTRWYAAISEDYPTFIPENWNGGEVTSAKIAFEIAEPILVEMCGKEQIESEKPYSINLVDGIWILLGSLHAPEGKIVLGGTMYVEISKHDGRILTIIQGE